MKHKLKLLIIDQSPLVVPRIKNLLSYMADDIIIVEARSRTEASELLELVIPDVVLLDLPREDSIDMLSKFKTGYPPVKVIVFTNYTDTSFLNTCMQTGADYFFEKSTEFNLVPVILSEMISDDEYEIAY
jgi:DNA-binding NarL/FixJ family response regulator